MSHGQHNESKTAEKDTVLQVSKENGEIISSKGEIADTLCTRIVGLLGRKGLDSEQALILTRCKQVHMFFMKFSIDVLFCSSAGEVLAVEENLKPWRASKFVRRSSFVIELPEGKIKEKKIRVGEKIAIIRD